MAAPPDPVTPGLLDLLTIAALGSSRTADSEAPTGASSPRFAVATDRGNHRLWVEVEA